MSTKTEGSSAPKKYKSKLFRVATEGATTDGRTIEREWIEQMAATYNPKKYGARIWLEHFRGIIPDSPFRAYGDVVAVESREVEDGKLALFAQIDPTEDLIDMTNNRRQKIYTSIEINPKFADTNSCYLIGLGITDSPASLGTDVLSFAAKNPQSSPFTTRKQSAENLFSEAVETELEFVADESSQASLLERVKAALKFGDAKHQEQTQKNQDFAQAAEELAKHSADLESKITKQADLIETMSATIDKLETKVQDLTQRLDTEPGKHTQRPPATGSTGQILTDI